MKILVVEDDKHISELISLYLSKEGFEVKQIYDGNSALNEFANYQPDLVLLDLMLPGKDGYSICREIRKTSPVPIIILTAKGETFDKVLGFEFGADDYVVKPFEPKELIARIKAVLRRYEIDTKKQTKSITYGDISINSEEYTITYRGQKVNLPYKEFEILLFFMSHPDKVYTREQLLNEIWGYDFYGDTRTIDVHIKRIREHIPSDGEIGIKTVRGVGYKFAT